MKKNLLVLFSILLLVVTMFVGCAESEETAPTKAPSTATTVSTATVKPTEKATAKPTQTPVGENTPSEDATDEPSPDTTATVTEGPIVTTAPKPTDAPKKLKINYVQNGLVALYQGNCNTAEGLDEDEWSWTDLSGSGNNLEELTINDYLYFSKEGFYIESQVVRLPNALAETISTGEFTLEFDLADFDPTGTDWICFFQEWPKDQFSFFYNVKDQQLQVKLSSNTRPKYKVSAENLANHKYSVTVSLKDKAAILYVDGVEVAKAGLTKSFSVESLLIGHNAAQRCYTGTYESIRFYNRALTPAEVAQNAALDTGVTFG